MENENLAEKKSVEELAREKLELLDASTVRTLLTSCRSTWTRNQSESVKTDKILSAEKDAINDDEELKELLVQEQIIKARIAERIRTLIDGAREVPFKLSSRGVCVRLEDYDLAALSVNCEAGRMDITPYHYEGVAYIKPVSIAKTAEGSLKEIIEILKSTPKEPAKEPMIGEQLEAYMADKERI